MPPLISPEQVLTPELRPHQIEAVNALAAASDKFAYVEMAVASGKSLVMARLAQIALPRSRVVIVAHTEELVKQNAKACEWLGEKPSICSAALGQKAVFANLTVGTVGTIAKRIKYFKGATFIVDEVHRARMHAYDSGAESQYLKIKNESPNSWFRGVTATGWREDGSGTLDNTFGPCVYKYGFLEALQDGFVKPLRAVTAKAPEIETKGLKTNSTGEWSGTLLTNRGVALASVHTSAYLQAMEEEGRSRALVFACDIEHANALEAACVKAGVDGRAVHTERGARGETVDAFRNGDFPVMISVAMFNVGFDVPDIDFMAFCRPMKSKLLYAQSLGRGARLSDLANDCAVADFGGNIARHGALDMMQAPKRRGPGKAKDADEEEKIKLPTLDRTVGGDLRQGATAGSVLSEYDKKPCWVLPAGSPTYLVDRHLWLIPTTIGRVRWFSPNYPRDAIRLYCEYDARRGWTALGARDSMGALRKA